MDKLILTDTGGLPFKLDDKLWENGELDASNIGQYDALQAALDQYGTDFIVSGCTYAAPNLTAGWIMLGGELLYVEAQAGTTNFFEKVTTFDARGSKTFKDTGVNNTYEINRGILSAVSGAIDITSPVRLGDKIVIDIAANSTEEFAVANIPDLPASKTTSGTFNAGRIPLATESMVGGRELATQAETDTGINDITILTPLKLRASSQFGGLLTTVVDIGDWDMDASSSVNVPHGVGDGSDIRSITVLIRNDSDDAFWPLNFANTSGVVDGSFQAEPPPATPDMVLRRRTGGIFDSTEFNSTSFNRGWIVIQHVPV